MFGLAYTWRCIMEKPFHLSDTRPESRDMPPEGEPRLKPEDAARATDWIARRLHDAETLRVNLGGELPGKPSVCTDIWLGGETQVPQSAARK